MGYIVVLILGAVVVIGIVAAFMSGRRRPVGRTKPYDDVTPKKPETDTLNPAASSTAPQNQVDAAQRRTPPA